MASVRLQARVMNKSNSKSPEAAKYPRESDRILTLKTLSISISSRYSVGSDAKLSSFACNMVARGYRPGGLIWGDSPRREIPGYVESAFNSE